MAAIVCPQDCTAALPPVNFDKCAPKFKKSEIVKIYIAKVTAAPIATPGTAAEWVTRLSMTDVANEDTIRPLVVTGDKPAPTSSKKRMAGGLYFNGSKKHVVNFTYDQINTANHDFMRTTECGTAYKVWYETAGGLLFGGSDGIIGTVTVDMVLEGGEEGMMQYKGTIEWEDQFTEEWVVSPIAA